MAFNPLANFQKYKKIWMAGILMITMVTFVLCSGFGDQNSGLQGLLQRMFAKRGDVIARIDGTSYYSDDFRQLKENRELANKYMRKVIEASAGMLHSWLKNPEDLKQLFRDRDVTPHEQAYIARLYREYQEKLKRPRYFEGTNKLDDLVNFQVLLRHADSLPVHLTDKFVDDFIRSEAILFIPAQRAKEGEEEEPIRIPLLSKDDYARISLLVQREGQGITDDRIAKALKDEYRAQLARYALLEAPNEALPGNMEMQKYMRHSLTERPVATRVSISPEQVREYHKKYRATFDVTLVPVEASELAKTVGAPDNKALLEFFNAHKGKAEDISSDQIGLQYSRDRFTVHYLMADPKSPQFKNKAAATLALQLAPPVAWNPMMPPLMTYLNYPLTDALAGEVIEKRIAERAQLNVEDVFDAGRVGDENYAHYLLGYMAKNRPDRESVEAVVNLIAGGLGDGPQILSTLPVYSIHNSIVGKVNIFHYEVARQQEKDRAARMPVFATFMSMTEDPVLALPAAWAVAEPFSRFRDEPYLATPRKLPLSIYQDLEWDRLVTAKATDYVRDIMKEVRERLKSSAIAGNESRLKPVLKGVIEFYGLTHVASKKPYTLSEMEQAPELEPLKKAFEKHAQTVDFFEGRRDEKMLSGRSFAQALFFTPGEKHSVGGRSYTPTAWPPDMELQQHEQIIKAALAYSEGQPIRGEKIDPREAEALESFMKIPDPSVPKTEVGLFERSENPIIFWKEDPPKGEATPRWETEIAKDVERQIKAIEADLEKRVARIKADPKLSDADKTARIETAQKGVKAEEAALRKKAAEEAAEVRERTLRIYKMTEARDKLAPELASKLAKELAATGGDSTVSFRPYEDSIAKLNKEPIVLRDLAQWYRVRKKSGDFEYRDFSISSQDNIPFPRADMAKHLLALPTLTEAIKTDYAPIDELNKELFSLSQKAFEELKAAKKTLPGAKARIVQVIPNRPRSVYYIALLTSTSNPPQASFREFMDSLLVTHTGGQDPFIERVYLEAGKQWREDVFLGLRRRMKVEVPESEATKTFDTDSGS